MTRAAGVFVSFGGDGFPDTEWLSIHANHSQQQGDVLRASALRWLIEAFTYYTELSDDQSKVCAGSYRMFEFAVSLEWATHYKKHALSADFPDPKNPEYSEIIRDEIHACEGNFLAVTQFSSELEPYGELGRWSATVPGHVPGELSEFTDEYLRTLALTTALPHHDEALREYSIALSRLISSTEDTFVRAAGYTHAKRVVLASSSRTNPVRSGNDPS